MPTMKQFESPPGELQNGNKDLVPKRYVFAESNNTTNGTTNSGSNVGSVEAPAPSPIPEPVRKHKKSKAKKILLAFVNWTGFHVTYLGLAKSIPDADTHMTSSNVAGTLGYIAPEYHQTMKFTDKCDMYSFGVLLAVLVIGKLPSDEFFQRTNEMSLVKWMRNMNTITVNMVRNMNTQPVNPLLPPLYRPFPQNKFCG